MKTNADKNVQQDTLIFQDSAKNVMAHALTASKQKRNAQHAVEDYHLMKTMTHAQNHAKMDMFHLMGNVNNVQKAAQHAKKQKRHAIGAKKVIISTTYNAFHFVQKATLLLKVVTMFVCSASDVQSAQAHQHTATTVPQVSL